MNDNERRAIVWETIERIAFRPNQPANWLSVYARTLHNLWGMDRIWAHFRQNDEFIIPFLNLKCCFLIESKSKYNISFVHDSSDCQHWQFHVDPGFLSKASLQTCVGNYPQKQMDELSRDVEAVLNGMLFHPRCHIHLEYLGIPKVQLDQSKGGLSSHDVRIGGGVENPFIFLFHLRYQFCLVHTDARRDERQRLIALFESSIRSGHKKEVKEVNARCLFNYKQ